MRRGFLAAALAVAGATLVLAACSAGGVRPAAPPAPTAALWQVTGGASTMYITGESGASLTKYPVSALMNQAFAQSGELVVEADAAPTPANRAKVAGMVMQMGLLPAGETLAGQLSAAQAAIVKQAFTQAGMPWQRLQVFRPWMATAALAKASVARFDIAPHALYQHFDTAAKQANMPVVYLDTLAQEVHLMAGMSDKVQASMLTMTAKQYLKPPDPAARAAQFKAWRGGNPGPLAAHAAAQFKGHPAVYAAAVTSRHPRWLKTLEGMLAKPGKPAFVIVGAPHLFGPGNLLAGLRKAGYKVVQQ